MKEIVKLDKTELLKLLNEKKEEIRQIAFGVAGSKAKNVKQTLHLKKDVARILTQINSLTK